MRLKGKVVLITASTRGIGLACAVRCAKEGAVVYMAARNMERAEARAQELNEQGYTVKTVFNDASDKDSYRTMVEEVIRRKEGSMFSSIISEHPIRRKIWISKVQNTRNLLEHWI